MRRSGMLLSCLALILGFAVANAKAQIIDGPASIRSLSFRYDDVAGIGKELGVCRRDPSDVIKVGDVYHIYYTKVVKDALLAPYKPLYPSGYPGKVWHAVSRDEGRTWDERGEVIGLGTPGAFDSFGVFTPNVLAIDGKFWLYYTAVKPTVDKGGVFENNSTVDRTAIGVAAADSPDGPFIRATNNPVLAVGHGDKAFDSYRVDDACLLARGGKVWLYYKGRSAAHGRDGPRRTRMGLAVANHPAGPFVRQNGGRPVLNSGHEVQIFSHAGGVLSLVSPTGPKGRTLQYADDGKQFRVLLRGMKDLPMAPGLSRAELNDGPTDIDLPTWGIAMTMSGGDPHLVRYSLIWNAR